MTHDCPILGEVFYDEASGRVLVKILNGPRAGEWLQRALTPEERDALATPPMADTDSLTIRSVPSCALDGQGAD